MISKLRSPQFGSSLQIDCFVKTRYTHGGQLKQIRTDSKHANQLHFVFQALKQSQVDALIQFLKQNAARRVVLTDENGQQWYGFVTTDKIKFRVHGRDSGACRLWDTEFDFEGVADTEV